MVEGVLGWQEPFIHWRCTIRALPFTITRGTTKGASTTISEDGLKKLAQDLGLELVNQTVNVKTTTQTTGTPTSIFVKADTSAGQKIIIPLINK